MNNRVAKQLRKRSRNNTIGLALVNYRYVGGRVKNARSIVMGKCTRQVYKRMKREYKKEIKNAHTN